MTDSISITDTGKRTTSSGSAEESDLVNSGSAVSLFGVEVSVEDVCIMNTTPTIGKTTSGSATTMFTYGQIDVLGTHQPKWTVKGVLRSDNSTDMAKVKMLRDLPKTKGYKTLSGDLADWSDGSDNSTTVNVFVEKVTLIQFSTHNIIQYTITMYETA